MNLSTLTEKGWRNRMQDASFRGVTFFVDAHEAKGGRRKARHEYPGSEESDVEDMGQKAWDYTLTAYCIGDDYDTKRDELLAALNQPDPAWLVHPWLGRLWVTPESWTVSETIDKGGYCAMQIVFWPTREDEAANAAAADTVDLAISAAGQFGDLVESDFDFLEMSAEGFAAFKAVISEKLETLRQVISVATVPLTIIQSIHGMITGALADIDVILSIPGRYASTVRSVYNMLTHTAAGVASCDKPRIIEWLVRQTAVPVATVTGPAAYEPAVQGNIRAENTLTNRIITETIAELAIDEYESADDRDAVLATVTETIDRMLPDMSDDDMFQAAMEMRTRVVDALTLQDLAPAVTRMIAHPLPARVLAHRLEMNVEDFVARNAISHPLFVSGRIHG